MFEIILIIFALSAVISWFWADGIDYMNKRHPNYKGEDFLNSNESKKNESPVNFDWDDNKIHSEGNF